MNWCGADSVEGQESPLPLSDQDTKSFGDEKESQFHLAKAPLSPSPPRACCQPKPGTAEVGMVTQLTHRLKRRDEKSCSSSHF